MPSAQRTSLAKALGDVPLITIEDLLAEPGYCRASPQPDDIAYLQYRYDDTHAIKAVAMSHRCVLLSLAANAEFFALTPWERTLNWLPLHHMLGLFHGVLLPLFGHFPGYLFSHLSFAQRPINWLEAISRYHITVSASVGAGLSACIQAAKPVHVAQLKLSQWRIAYVAGKFADQSILQQFSQTFVKSAFNPEFFSVCLPLVECPLPLPLSTPIATDFFIEKGLVNQFLITDASGLPLRTATENPETMGKAIDEIIAEGKGKGKGKCEAAIGELWLQSDLIDSHYRSPAGDIPALAAPSPIQTAANYLATGYSARLINGRLEITEALPKETAPRVDNSPYHRGQGFAIIGMAGVFPKSDHYDELWQHLESAEDLIDNMPLSRWCNPVDYHQWEEDSFALRGGFIKDHDFFDASFFDISSREAQLMDPMHRKLLHVIWQAIEDAGYRMSRLADENVGLFIAMGAANYLQLAVENQSFNQHYASEHVVQCLTASRIANVFNFQGPVESIDTACSSSLVALHRAASALARGECELAIVAGVNILAVSQLNLAHIHVDLLSRSGQCKTFDSQADGYVRGEGVGVLVLRRLEDAQYHNDYIHALLKGSAVNHTASSLPNPFAQAEVISAALNSAQVEPATVGMVEAHGISTPLSDSVEINGLKSALTESSSNVEAHCSIGSIKTNVGHLEAAAGIAGVMKAILAIRHQRIPAHLHLTTINPDIDISDTHLQFAGQASKPWEPLCQDGQTLPRRAGVSAFGFGRVNAHVLIEEYQATSCSHRFPVTDSDNDEMHLFILSAKDNFSLTLYIKRYIQFIEQYKSCLNLSQLIYTLQIGRESMPVRLAIVVSDMASLLDKLKQLDSDRQAALYHCKQDILFNVVDHKITPLIEQDRRRDHFVSQCLLNRQWFKLAQLWVLGGHIDWAQHYQAGVSLQPIPLPVYPFVGRRHWVSPSEEADDHLQDKDEGVYSIEWMMQAKEVSYSVDASTLDTVYILCSDDKGIANRFAYRLASLGVSYIQIYRTFRPRSGPYYTLDPKANLEHFVELMEVITKEYPGRALRIINFWPLDFQAEEDYSGDDIVSHSDDIIQAVLYLSQSIATVSSDISVKLWCVCAHVQPIQTPVINLYAAPLWGFCKTLLLEKPHIFQAVIDIGGGTQPELDSLLQDIFYPDREGEIVYRQQQRLVPRLLPVKPEVIKPVFIDPEGVYLITGGFGKLGLNLAEWLVSLGARHLLLVGTRPMAAYGVEACEVVERLEASGVEVTSFAIDVTDLTQLRDACQVYIDNGSLVGVFHLAGYYQQHSIAEMSLADYQRISRAKIAGAWNLIELTRGYHLEHLVLFSSAASVWGDAMASHYSASNYFLDSFAHYCDMNHIDVTTVNWGIWANSSITPSVCLDHFHRIGIQETSRERGFSLLHLLLGSDHHLAVAAEVDWPQFIPVMNYHRQARLLEFIGAAKSVGQLTKMSLLDRIATHVPVPVRHYAISQALISIVRETLELDDQLDIPLDEPLFAIGLDSLSSVDFKHKVEQAFGLTLTATTLFSHNTLRLLANSLLQQYQRSMAFMATTGDERHIDQWPESMRPEGAEQLLNTLKLEFDSF